MKTCITSSKKGKIYFAVVMFVAVFLPSLGGVFGGLYAQNTDLTGNVWFANSITINNQTTQAPRTPEMTIQVYFDNDEMLSEMCCAGQMELELIYDNAQSTFEITNILTTTQNCTDSNNNNFRDLYVDFFQNSSTEEFDYDIQTIMAGFGEYMILTITNIAGDTIEFYNSPHDTQVDYYIFGDDHPSQTHWYLYSLKVNGTWHSIPEAVSLQTSITFSRDGGFITGICGEIDSKVGFINDDGNGPFGSGEFYILCEELTFTPGNCSDTSITDIEQHYHNFLQNLVNGNIAVYKRGHVDFTDVCGSVEILDISDPLSNSSIKLIDCVEPMSLHSFTSLPSIIVYPNPTNDKVYINSREGSNIFSIEIIDINGKLVKKYHSGQTAINIADLKAGIYFLNINSDNNIITKKIVKK